MKIHSNAVNCAESVGALNIDVTNNTHLLYAGAAVIGSTVVVGSVAVTTVAAPGVVLIPAAVATGMAVYGSHLAEKSAADAADKINDDTVTA